MHPKTVKRPPTHRGSIATGGKVVRLAKQQHGRPSSTLPGVIHQTPSDSQIRAEKRLLEAVMRVEIAPHKGVAASLITLLP